VYCPKVCCAAKFGKGLSVCPRLNWLFNWVDGLKSSDGKFCWNAFVPCCGIPAGCVFISWLKPEGNGIVPSCGIPPDCVFISWLNPRENAFVPCCGVPAGCVFISWLKPGGPKPKLNCLGWAPKLKPVCSWPCAAVYCGGWANCDAVFSWASLNGVWGAAIGWLISAVDDWLSGDLLLGCSGYGACLELRWPACLLYRL
jgi:hypothetical protein